MRLLRQLPPKGYPSDNKLPADRASKVVTSLDEAVQILEFAENKYREILRTSYPQHDDTYRAYQLFYLSDGEARAVKDPHYLIVRNTDQITSDPKSILKRLIDFLEGKTTGMSKGRDDLTATINKFSGKHFGEVRTTLSGSPLSNAPGSATEMGVTIDTTGGKHPSLTLSASSAARGSDVSTESLRAFLEGDPLGLPFSNPTISESNGVANAEETVKGTPGLNKKGEPDLIKSDTVLDVNMYQYGYDFQIEGEGITTTNSVTVPNDRPLGMRGTSSDIVHSARVSGLHVNLMGYPGKEQTVLLFPSQLPKGKYNIRCAEYCGPGHSSMLADLTVTSRTEYEAWKQKQRN